MAKFQCICGLFLLLALSLNSLVNCEDIQPIDVGSENTEQTNPDTNADTHTQQQSDNNAAPSNVDPKTGTDETEAELVSLFGLFCFMFLTNACFSNSNTSYSTEDWTAVPLRL